MIRSISAAIITGVLLVGSHALAADNYAVHGSTCHVRPSQASYVDYGQYGIGNLSTTTELTVFCPVHVKLYGGLNTSLRSVLYQFSMSAYDRNPTTNVQCSLKRLNTDGNTAGEWVLNTTSYASGYQSISVQPYYTFLGGEVLFLTCSIPPSNSTNGMSHFTVAHLTFFPA